MSLAFWFARPKKPSNPYPRGDCDKYVRGCLDALTGILYRDDSQVVAIAATKHYVTDVQGVQCSPGVMIEIAEAA